MSSSFRVLPVKSTGDIDSAALLKFIFRKKELLLIVILMVSLVATCYALLLGPKYKVSVVLRPAAINDLDALNRSEIYQFSPVDALFKVGAALESYDTRLAFFKANQQLFSTFVRPGQALEQSFEAFNRDFIHLTLPSSDERDARGGYVKLEMIYPKGVDGVAILNGLVDYAISSERKQISADVSVIVQNRINELKEKFNSVRSNYNVGKEAKIAYLREADSLKYMQLQDELMALRLQLKALRSDRIEQLNEAIVIAKTLGIQKPASPSSLGESGSLAASRVVRTEINNQQIPLYFMGVDALKAEVAALAQRRSDDFTNSRVAQIAKELKLLASNREVEVLNARENEDLFLAGVQPLRAEIARLTHLNSDMAVLKLVSVDQRALEPLAPESPNRLLIIAIGIFCGIVFAFGIAIISYIVAVRSPSY